MSRRPNVRTQLAAAAIAGAGLLAGSCSEPPVPEVERVPAVAPFSSGTRLRVTYLDVDGLRIFWRLFDTNLGRDCSLGAWGADGARYCLPADRVPTESSPSVFRDALCTEPLVQDLRPSCTPPDYLVHDDGTHEVVYARGPEVPSDSLYAVFPGMGCLRARFSGSAPRYLRLGPPMPMTTFVATHDAVLETGGRIAVLARRADDGTLFRAGGWDSRQQWPVEPLAGSEDASAWVPARAALWRPELFHDADCTQEVASSSLRVPAPSTAVVTYDAHGSLATIHEIGASVTGMLYARDGNGECRIRAPEPDTKYYKVGTSVPIATMERSRTVEVGTGRLHAMYLADAAGTPIEPLNGDLYSAMGAYRDTARDERCAFVEMPGGSPRCLPAGPYFPTPKPPDASELMGASDVVLPIAEGTAPPRTVTYRRVRVCDELPLPVVYVVGAKYRTISGTDYYLLTETVPLDAFVTGTLRRE